MSILAICAHLSGSSPLMFTARVWRGKGIG
jgi:hypothetical protein